MRAVLRRAIDHELDTAAALEVDGAFDAAFAHIERAHILSQRFALTHARVHLRMLRVGWKRRDGREVVGQVSRFFAAIVFSRVWVPAGNTGGANVSALKAMPLPADLQALLYSLEP